MKDICIVEMIENVENKEKRYRPPFLSLHSLPLDISVSMLKPIVSFFVQCGLTDKVLLKNKIMA